MTDLRATLTLAAVLAAVLIAFLLTRPEPVTQQPAPEWDEITPCLYDCPVSRGA